jgi:hypothetical protein
MIDSVRMDSIKERKITWVETVTSSQAGLPN